MSRDYLYEDLEQIKRYFPGARAVAMRTPFDLTEPEDRQRLLSDDVSDKPGGSWYGGLLWNRS